MYYVHCTGTQQFNREYEWPHSELTVQQGNRKKTPLSMISLVTGNAEVQRSESVGHGVRLEDSLEEEAVELSFEG